ncbi:endothelin-converting enzyme 1-like isoform X2 [Amblyomma americanum]
MAEEKEAPSDSPVAGSTVRSIRNEGSDREHRLDRALVPISSEEQVHAAEDGTEAKPAPVEQAVNEGNKNRKATASTSPKQRRHGEAAGAVAKPAAAKPANIARDSKRHRVTASPTHGGKSLSSRAAAGHSLRRSPAPSPRPPGGNALISLAEQRQNTTDAQDLSLSSGSPSQRSPASGLSSVRGFRDPAASRLTRPAPSPEKRGASAPPSLLRSISETSWVSTKKPVPAPAAGGFMWRPLAPPSPAAVVSRLALVPPSAERNAVIAGITITAILLLIAAAITTLVVAFRVYVPPAEGSKLCDTVHCRMHATLLTARLNEKMDPCEDFGAYVCSAWTPSGDYREHVKTPVDGVALSRLAGFGTLLVQGTLKLPAGAKALVMHESCLSAADHGGLYLQQFRALMLEMGLSWPEPPQENRGALDVLMALAYKWQVYLWLEVRVLALPGSNKWRLTLKPASVLPVFLNQYESVKDSSSYSAYWMGYYKDLSLNSTELMNESSLEATIKETLDIEGTALTNLNSLVFAKMRIPAVFPLGSIGNHSQPITSATWMTALQGNIALSPRLSADDDMVLSDENLLKTVGSFFQNYTEAQILGHYAWMFVQMYAPVAEPRMLLRLFGDMHKVNAYRNIFCGSLVECTFRVLVLSLNVASRIKQEEMDSIRAGFEGLVSAAVEKVNSSKWLDGRSKRVAGDKLKSVKMRVWPDQQLMSNEELERTYKSYPSTEDSFAEYWMEARRSMRRSNERVRHINDSHAYHDALMLPFNIAPSYPMYDYVSGSLAVPMYTLEQPLYYSGGTTAMFLGGLGYLLALSLVKALDKVGIRWLPNGTRVDSIFPEQATKAFEEKDGCLKGDGMESVFPELPALEIAYSALEAAGKSGVLNRSIQKDLPPAKVFFMTICYMACSLSGFKSAFSADCNKIVRNSAAFASTFNCSSGSKMNPEKKCRVFD